MEVGFRLAVLLLLVSAVGFSGFSRARAARGGTIRRSAEGGAALLGRMLVALPLLVMILTWVAKPEWLAWAAVDLPFAVRVAALVLGVAAVLGSMWTLVTIGSNISPTVLTREGQRLVSNGPYRWVRHPLYACGALLLISIGVVSESLLILSWLALGLILLFVLVIPREEEQLVRRFGAEFERYRERTGAVVPRLR